MKFFFEDEGNLTEKQIQILYQTHPYLVEKEFLKQKVVPQYPLPSGFADIVVFKQTEIVIVELKVDPLKTTHILQLNGYLEDMERETNSSFNFRGIIIGKESKEDLNKTIRNLKYKIKILILTRDIPIKIKICDKCRLANDIKNEKCFNCLNNKFI